MGVINDYITFASDSISNRKLDFSLVGYDSMEEEVQALKDGQIDLIFHFAQNPYVAEENNFVLSNTVLTLNMAAVTAQNSFNENHANTVALLKDDLLLKWYVSYLLSGLEHRRVQFPEGCRGSHAQRRKRLPACRIGRGREVP